MSYFRRSRGPASEGTNIASGWDERRHMKPIITVVCVAALYAATAEAQSTTETTRTKTKMKVDDGKEVTVAGCVAENPGGGYMLTDTGGGMRYALVGGEDVSKHLGHRIEVKGKA